MRRISSGISVALIVSLALGAAAQEPQPPNIGLTFTGLAPGQEVQFVLTIANMGKSGSATASQQGAAVSVFDFANQAKPEMEVDVYTFTCPEPPTPPRVVVKMVERGSPAPDDPCGNRRLVGAFWLHRARALSINVAAGTMDVNYGTQLVKWALIGGGVAAVVTTVAIVAGGDSSTNGQPPTTTTTGGAATTTTTTSGTGTTTTTTSSSTTTTTTTTTTTSSQIPYTALNGTYAKSATRTTNNCNNFFVPSFNGTLRISGVDADGQGGTLTEQHPSQTFVYNVTIVRSASGFTFVTNQIQSSIGGDDWNSSLFGTFSSPNNGTGTEQFTRANDSCFDTFAETYVRTGS